jgi:hypothetical protein
MDIPRLLLAILSAGIFPARLQAQAAVEYATKSARGPLSNAGDMHLGVCRLDSRIATCVQMHSSQRCSIPAHEFRKL